MDLTSICNEQIDCHRLFSTYVVLMNMENKSMENGSNQMDHRSWSQV